MYRDTTGHKQPLKLLPCLNTLSDSQQKLWWVAQGVGSTGGAYLDSLEGLLGVSLVGLMHQLTHLLRVALLALLVHRVDSAPQRNS